MRASSEEIAAKVRQPEWNLADHMGPVHHRDHAFGARRAADLADGHHQSGETRNAAEAQHAGARTDGGDQQIDKLFRAFGRQRNGHLAHGNPVARLLLQPGAASAGVFLIGNQHLIAGFQVQAAGHRAHRLGGVVHEGQFVFLTAEKIRVFGALRVHRFVAPARVLVS